MFRLLVATLKYQHMTQYNTSTQQVKLYDEISLAEEVAPNLWEVDQCFSATTYQQLKNIVDTPNNEFSNGFLKKRLELNSNGSDGRRIESIGCEMVNSISVLVGYPLAFLTAKYWLDLPDFGCQTHQDHQDIFVSYQVYLGSALRDEIRSDQHRSSNIDFIKYLDTTNNNDIMAVGATFLHVDPPVQIKFKPNHGYINVNSDLKPHRVDGTWDTRISVMFQYSRV